MKPVSSATQGWFVGRLPDGWFSGPPEITYDRDEILVVGTLPDPEGAGEDAEVDLRLPELRRLRGDDQVAEHGELTAAAEREAGDGGDDPVPAGARHEQARDVRPLVLGEHAHG